MSASVWKFLAIANVWSCLHVTGSTTPSPSPTAQFSFGSDCTYTLGSQTTFVPLAAGKTATVATIPAGKFHVFIEVSASYDIDLILTANTSGTVLLSESSQTNWNDDGYLSQFEHNNMTIKACVDLCDASVNATYHNGENYALKGSKELGKEFLYVDETSEELLVQVQFHKNVGVDGTVYVHRSWDCDSTKCNQDCVGITNAPTLVPTTMAPSFLPTLTGAPTRAPSFVPTLPPSSIPTAAPIAPTSLPTNAPTSIPIPLPSLVPSSAPTPVPSTLKTNETCSFYDITAGKPPESCTDAISNCFKCFACCDNEVSRLYASGDLKVKCETTAEGYGKHCHSSGNYTCGCHPRMYEVSRAHCNTTWGLDAAQQCLKWHASLP